jgi:hypothetical protein
MFTVKVIESNADVYADMQRTAALRAANRERNIAFLNAVNKKLQKR